MVQVIGPGTRKPSFGERLSTGIGRGLEFSQQLMQQQQALQQQEQARMAAEQLGLDPSVLQLPEHAQAAYFKQAFAPEKQMTPLQQSQQRLAEERLKALQGQQDLFKQLTGQGQIQQPGMETQEQGLLSQLPEDNLRQLSAFAGQPGQQGTIGTMAKNELDRRKQEKEFSLKEKKLSPEFKREQQLESAQAQADVKYNQQLQEASKQHELKERTLDRLEELNKKGVTGKSYEKFLEKIGLVNLTSEGRREFAADVKNLITDIRSILGAQFTGFEFQTILNAYPSADFSKEANTAIIKNLKDFQDIKRKEVEFAQQIKKENSGRIPFDFQSLVNEKVRQYAADKLPDIKENTRKIMNEEYGITDGFTLMFDPQGNEMSVPESEVANMLDIGATLP